MPETHGGWRLRRGRSRRPLALATAALAAILITTLTAAGGGASAQAANPSPVDVQRVIGQHAAPHVADSCRQNTIRTCLGVRRWTPEGLTSQGPGWRTPAAQGLQKRLDNAFRQQAARSRAVAAAATPSPVECDTAKGTGTASYPDRIHSCSEMYWYMESWIEEDGVVTITGLLSLTDFQWLTYQKPNSTAAPAWTHGFQMHANWAWGDLVGGLPMNVASGCDGSYCFVDGFSGPGGTIDVVEGGEYDYEFEESDLNVTLGPGIIDDLTHGLGVAITQPEFGTGLFDDGSFDGQSDAVLVGRCDSVNGPNSTVTYRGCVDQRATSLLIYNAILNPKVGPVADHIFSAQHTMPVKYGVPASERPLTRDTSDADMTANNTAACASVTIQPGESCDEYPLASTYQGASFIGAENGSAVAVPIEANNSQGGITTNFYRDNRVLDGDAFWVLAIKADGSTSW